MKQRLQYVLGIVAFAVGMLFCIITFPLASSAIVHLNDAAYEQPASLAIASRIFSVLAGIIACLANCFLPEEQEGEPGPDE